METFAEAIDGWPHPSKNTDFYWSTFFRKETLNRYGDEFVDIMNKYENDESVNQNSCN